MKKRKWVWVSRDIGGSSCCIWAGDEKPVVYSILWDSKSDYIVVCAKFLFKFTGINVKPGECKRVEFSGKIVGE